MFRSKVVSPPTAQDAEIQAAPNTVEAGLPDEGHPEKLHDAVPSPDVQLGVQKIEAVTLAWSKASLAALLVKYATSLFLYDLIRRR